MSLRARYDSSLCIEQKIMACWFAGNGMLYGNLERCIRCAATHKVAQVNPILLPQTGIELSGARKAHTIA